MAYKNLLITVFFLFITYQANSEISMVKPPLTVQLHLDSEIYNFLNEDEQKILNNNWQKNCQLLGKNLQPGFGPAGFGVFSNFKCHPINSETISNSWYIQINENNHSLTISVYGLGIHFGRLKFKTAINLFTILSNSSFRSLLAISILDLLPMMTQINSKNYPAFSALAMDPSSIPQNVRLPQNYTLYHLYFDNNYKLWRGKVIDQIGKNTPTKTDLNSMPDYTFMWAHNSEGIGLIANQLNENLVKKIQSNQRSGKKEKKIS